MFVLIAHGALKTSSCSGVSMYLLPREPFVYALKRPELSLRAYIPFSFFRYLHLIKKLAKMLGKKLRQEFAKPTQKFQIPRKGEKTLTTSRAQRPAAVEAMCSERSLVSEPPVLKQNVDGG